MRIDALVRSVSVGRQVLGAPQEVAVRSEADAGRLSILPWSGSFSVNMQVAWHARRWISPAMAALLETARETFRAA